VTLALLAPPYFPINCPTTTCPPTTPLPVPPAGLMTLIGRLEMVTESSLGGGGGGGGGAAPAFLDVLRILTVSGLEESPEVSCRTFPWWFEFTFDWFAVAGR